jgi:hypothetical protein
MAQPLARDTHPAIERLQLRIIVGMQPCIKVQLTAELNDLSRLKAARFRARAPNRWTIAASDRHSRRSWPENDTRAASPRRRKTR